MIVLYRYIKYQVCIDILDNYKVWDALREMVEQSAADNYIFMKTKDWSEIWYCPFIELVYSDQ